jgi:hypothetical protein
LALAKWLMMETSKKKPARSGGALQMTNVATAKAARKTARSVVSGVLSAVAGRADNTMDTSVTGTAGNNEVFSRAAGTSRESGTGTASTGSVIPAVYRNFHEEDDDDSNKRRATTAR